jgi:hypothetical protein
MKHHLAKIRTIKKLDYNTPMLVPSFSSKGFPHVKELHNYLKEKLTEVSLVSTYDLYYDNLNSKQIYESDVLIIDSGGYERNQEHDISDIYNSLYIPREWNEKLYEGQVASLEPITDILLVNFDYKEAFPLKMQIELAQKHFEKYPHFATDFLCKPTTKDSIFLDVETIIKSIDHLCSFDVVGFTEKELGNSIYARANNIYRIRKAFIDAEQDTPIHIFGCIDPLSIVLYFLCGADIFDGLSWLRFSFKDTVPTYLNHFAINSGHWNSPDNEVKIISYLQNLEELSKLKKKLIEFTESLDWEKLQLKTREEQEIKLILSRIIENYG